MANTANRAYPRPDVARDIADEFPVSDQALVLVDADVHALFQAILGLAPLSHTHPTSDVTGLEAALAGKAAAGHAHSLDDLSDVSGAAAAPNTYLLVKTGGAWVPASPASVIGAHGHAIADVLLLQAALDAAQMPAQIAAAVDEAFPNDAMLVARKADGTLIQRSWTNVKSLVGSSFGGLINGMTLKATPVDADILAIGDSEASNGSRRITLSSVAAYILTKVASAANFLANTNGLLGVNNVWASAVPVNLGAAWTGNQTLNLSTFIKGYATATGNFQFFALSNAKNQSGTIRVSASGGPRTPSFATASFATPFNAPLEVIASGTTRLYSYDYDSVLGKCVIVDLGTVS